ncbi:putative sterol-4-alpha-carboxylate 3-dehydrogenase, decarboxylating [Talaromyces proteolyticus]|uniref:Sterol-4-alpha-carboxylate 3-dehydrogenase, decarboxylating n=1 Tax=Talaromyces proteolyticus TaxID=1131652 RepID=A0AAD4KGV7_9EURO|nr:putative sterol-4-alpha-carboxylate 3-dehydrogenase, decarboxylating [Talaromyces proteolyticus]KAH8691435.1 putative sterol-4-alpha-carboxylate 3-dehydrogenase, decarboxylating [Talaromyces proteolyticus]
MATEQPITSALVVGGCGSLGRQVVKQLLALAPTVQVSVFDLRLPNTETRALTVEYHEVDITSRDQVNAALHKVQPQVIFHTASPLPTLLDLPLYLRVNVEGTRNLLESAKEAGTKAFVYTSSASVVHDSVSDLIEGDDSLPLLYMPQQREIYSHSKALADQLVLDSNSSTMLTTSIRPSGIFGENDDGTTKSMVENAAAGKLRFTIGNGKNLFDFTFNENVVHAHILAAQALLRSHVTPPPADLRVAGEGFLITNDEHIPFWDFARAIGAAAGYQTRPEDIRQIPKIVGIVMAVIAEWVVWATSLGRKKSRMNVVGIRYSCMTRTYSIDKAKKVLGYKPLVNLTEAILRSGGYFNKDAKKAV